MTEAQTRSGFTATQKRKEIDWAQYLDYTLFLEAIEIGNDCLDKFQQVLFP
jgi:hypothetical protein